MLQSMGSQRVGHDLTTEQQTTGRQEAGGGQKQEILSLIIQHMGPQPYCVPILSDQGPAPNPFHPQGHMMDHPQ